MEVYIVYSNAHYIHGITIDNITVVRFRVGIKCAETCRNLIHYATSKFLPL